MRKTVLFILSVIIVGFLVAACDDQKTTQEYIREEKKAIERFISRNDIRVLKDYPKDHQFAENEYYRTIEGLYMQVIDSGNGRKVKALVDRVQVRFDFLLDVKSSVTDKADTLVPPSTILPMQFVYGEAGSYGQPDPLYNFSCNGWAIPLQYVSEEAIVNLIIPSTLGTDSDNQLFIARFYKNLKYTKFY